MKPRAKKDLKKQSKASGKGRDIVHDVIERNSIGKRPAEQMLRELADHAAAGVAATDLKGRLTYVNQTMADFLGYSTEQLIGRPFKDYICREDRGKVMRLFLNIMLLRREPSELEFRTIRRDGSVRHLITRPSRIRAGRKTVGFSAIVMDITERKQMEERLKENEEHYRELAESITDMFFAMDRDLRCTYWNKASETGTGISAENAVGKTLREVFPSSKGRERAEETYLKAMREQQPQSFVNGFTLRNREYFFEIDAFPTRSGVAVIAKDITERMRMEKELDESVERYRDLFANSRDAITINTPDGNFVDFNQSFLDLLGYSKSELLGMKAVDAYADAADRDEFRKEIERNGFVKDFEVKIRRKDGALRDCLLTSTAWKDKKGHIIGYQGILRDITDRKRMEEQYEAILETALDGFWRVDASGRFLDVNDAYARMIGYSHSELLTMRIQDVEAKETATETAERIGRITSVGSDRFETRHRRKDGQFIDIEVSVNHLPDDGGQFFVFLREITERKRAEERLRLSEAKLKALHRHTRELAVAETIKEVAKQTLDAMEFTLGFDVADFCTVEKDHIGVLGSRGMQAAPKLQEWPLEGPGVVIKSIETKKTLKVSDTRKEPSFVDRRTSSETEKLQLSELAVPVLEGNTVVGVLNVESSELNAFTNADQELLETLATHVASALGRLRQVDTLEKLVEERTHKLMESEERLRTVYDSARDGIALADAESKRFYDGNKAFCEMLAVSLEELKTMGLVDIHPKENLTHVMEQFEKLAKREIALAKDIPVKRRDGSIFHADIAGAPSFWVGGCLFLVFSGMSRNARRWTG